MRSDLLLATLVGTLFGALGITALQAQGRPGAYVIEENDVIDQEALKRYGPQVEPTLQQYGGTYIVRGGRTVALLGEAPKRIVVLGFDSVEKAEAWFHSADYQALKPLRDQAMKKRSFIVEATAQKP
jgi:uncharacterized protein (DUF1330 family)